MIELRPRGAEDDDAAASEEDNDSNDSNVHNEEAFGLMASATSTEDERDMHIINNPWSTRFAFLQARLQAALE
jgi:hypothetical protein